MEGSHIIPPRTVTSMPRCLGCGFTVAAQGDLCEACAEKPQFGRAAPKGTIVTAPQPEPPYVRQGSFARPTEQVDEDAL